MGRFTKKPSVGFIFIILLIDVMGIGILIPVLPDLIIELKGVSTGEAAWYGGLIIGSYGVMQFLFAPLVGALSDKFGRRPILMLSLLGFTLDYLLMALAPTLSWLFLGRIIAGIMGASFATGSAYIADVSPPEKRSQNFGLIGVAFGLGFIIGPFIGGVLGDFGLRTPFFAAAVLTFLNWLYAVFILPESLPVEKRRAFQWKRANPLGNLMNLKRYPLIAGLVTALVFIYIASHAVQSNWSYFTKYRFEWDPPMIGYSLAFVGVLSALVQGGLIRVVIPRFGQARSIYIGMAFYVIGFILFASAEEGWMMYPYMVVYCIGGITNPALQGIMSNQVSDSEQGELQGALTSMMSITSVIGPVVMTSLFAFFTTGQDAIHLPGAPMYLAALLTVVSLALSWRTLRSFKG